MNINPVSIKKLVNGGYGLGRLQDGRAVLVQRALPGECVDIRILDDKKSYIQGIATTVHTSHAGRIIPDCPYYGDCGGCDLQHCDYATQLIMKKAIIADLLERHPSAELRQAADLLAEPLPSPAVFGYRQRIRLQIDSTGRPGFRRFHSHDIVPIGRCLLAREELNGCLAALQAHPSFALLMRHCSELELLADPDAERVVCLMHLRRKPRPKDSEAATRLCLDIALIDRIFFQAEGFPLGNAAKKPVAGGRERALGISYPPDDENAAALELSWEVGGFCQVNLAQNRRLIRTVLDFAGPDADEDILDLFCGMGNFSIPLAASARNLLGIEGQASAIRSARANGKKAGLTNVEFRQMPLHGACDELARSGRTFACVVIDPPRQGVPGLAPQLASLAAKRLVYVSCDPATLCRDLAELLANSFSLKRFQPIDMFPQTHHIETVVLLEKN
jgi:23S rRNA (uracil1939-C5)-methyltransferase